MPNSWSRNYAEVKWSCGRFYTLRLNILWYTDQMLNAVTPNASRSIISVLVSKSGGSFVVTRTTFILMTSSASTVFLTVLSLAPLPMSWSCEYAKTMEVIAGFWLVLAHCETNEDKLHVGMFRGRTLKTA